MHTTGKMSMQGGVHKIFCAYEETFVLNPICFRDVQHGIFRSKRFFNRHFIMISFPHNLVVLHIVVQRLE
jgi:hypothetical protein